jgi:CheY-like chemotaxis protein
MDNPILFLVDDEPEVRALPGRSTHEALWRRLLHRDRSLERLERARDRGEEGTLLVADQWMPEMTGVEWLARTRPSTREGLREPLREPMADHR